MRRPYLHELLLQAVDFLGSIRQPYLIGVHDHAAIVVEDAEMQPIIHGKPTTTTDLPVFGISSDVLHGGDQSEVTLVRPPGESTRPEW